MPIPWCATAGSMKTMRGGSLSCSTAKLCFPCASSTTPTRSSGHPSMALPPRENPLSSSARARRRFLTCESAARTATPTSSTWCRCSISCSSPVPDADGLSSTTATPRTASSSSSSRSRAMIRSSPRFSPRGRPSGRACSPARSRRRIPQGTSSSPGPKSRSRTGVALRWTTPPPAPRSRSLKRRSLRSTRCEAAARISSQP